MNNNIDEYIVYWNKLDTLINEKNKEIKLLKGQKEEYQNKVIEYLVENKLEKNVYSIDNNNIKCKTTSIKEPINLSYLETQIYTYFENDKDTANKLYQFLLDNRNTKTSMSLSKNKINTRKSIKKSHK